MTVPHVPPVPPDGRPPREAVDLLLHSGRLVTVDDGDRVFPDGAIAVREGVIVGVGRSAELRERFQALQLLDARGALVLPGLIDTHLHPALSMLVEPAPDADAEPGPWTGPKGLRSHAPQPGPLARLGQQPLGRGMLGFLQHLADADTVPPMAVYVLALHSLWMALRNGTTCFVEGGGGSVDAVAQAALDIGLRAGVGPALADLRLSEQGGQVRTECTADIDLLLARAEQAVTRWHGAGHGRIQGWLVLHTDVTASDALLQGAAALARQRAAGLTIHAASAAAQEALSQHLHGQSGLERLDALGVLSPAFLGVHMGAAATEDLPRLGAAGAKVAHCVGTSNFNGKGFVAEGTLWRIMEAGINLGLGTDTLFHGGLPSQMRAFRQQHKECQGDNRAVPPYQALLRATRHAARCVNREHEIGSLEVGKRADFIVVDTSSPEFAFGDPLTNFIDGDGGSVVRDVVIDGRIVMLRRRLVTLDEDWLLSEMRRTMAVAWAHAGTT